MKILVMGSGVIGVTTAYYLARDGHEVIVVDQHDEAALETSYANAGLVAPGHAFAWASPRAPGILAKSLFRADQALRLRPRLSRRQWTWLWLFLLQCTAERARANTLRKLRLCLYSVESLDQVVDETGVSFDRLDRGNFYLYRSPRTFDAGVAHTAILRDNGLELEIMDRDALARLEPALEPVKHKIAGGLYSPRDQSGDARAFSQHLAAWCAEHLGVEFRYGTRIRRIEAKPDRVARVLCDDGPIRADLYVLALGCASPFLAESIGIRLPIYPVKGYSVTVPVGETNASPRMGGVDEDNLVAICPMGKRLRITSTAEFAGYERGFRETDFRAMFNAAKDLFPSGGVYESPDYWAGLRPMTPTTVPVQGRAKYENLYLNTGHGHIGWTMSCGSGRLIADLVAGRQPEIDTEGLLY